VSSMFHNSSGKLSASDWLLGLAHFPALKVEAIHYSETLLHLHRSTLRYVPYDRTLQDAVKLREDS
jgi:hypothetical protein